MRIYPLVCFALLMYICCNQTPIMTFNRNANSTLLSSFMQYRWIQTNSGSPSTNISAIIFNRNSTDNKTVINISLNGIWTIAATTT